MKLKITFLMAFLTLVLSSYSVGSINIKGVDYEVDTTFHAKVGPGTTQDVYKRQGCKAAIDAERYLTNQNL